MSFSLQRLMKDKRNRRLALLVGMWVPALALVVAVREVLLPFLLAFALAYIIAPAVTWLSAQPIPWPFGAPAPDGARPVHHLPRWGSVLVLYAVAALVLWVGGRIFVPQLYKELSRLGRESGELFHQLSDDNIEKQARRLETFFDQYDLPIHVIDLDEDDEDTSLLTGKPPRGAPVIDVDLMAVIKDLAKDAKVAMRAAAGRAVGTLQAAVGAVVRVVFSTFLVLMLTAFIVADTERIFSFFFTVIPMRDRSRFQALLDRIDHGLFGVIRGQLTICIVNGVLTLIGLLLLKVKFAFLLGTVAAVFSLIPIFGSILSTIPIVIVGLASGPTTAILAVMWITFIHAVEANLLNPKIMGDAAKIHPVLVVLALVIGEHFYGLVGALFAVPLMSVVGTVFKAMRARAIELDAELHAEEDAAALAPALAPATPRRRLRLAQGS